MTRRGWPLRRARRRLGWPGLSGLGLIVLALLFYAGANLPERLQRLDLEQRVAAVRARPAPPSSAEAGIEARLATFYSQFPGPDSAPAWLEKIYGAGNAAALVLEKVDYKLSPDRNSRLLRYEVDLPVQGSYIQIRQFIQAILGDIPAIALREIQIQRNTIADPKVEAQIRFILYLREGR